MPCTIQVCTNSRRPAFCWKWTQRPTTTSTTITTYNLPQIDDVKCYTETHTPLKNYHHWLHCPLVYAMTTLPALPRHQECIPWQHCQSCHQECMPWQHCQRFNATIKDLIHAWRHCQSCHVKKTSCDSNTASVATPPRLHAMARIVEIKQQNTQGLFDLHPLLNAFRANLCFSRNTDEPCGLQCSVV